MTLTHMTIGALSRQADCAVPTIRYYEQIGLLPEPGREANGHRFYREPDLHRLKFVKRCRDFGFPIEQVRELASLFDDGDRPCVDLRDVATAHLENVRAKIADMRELEASLAAMIGACDASCAGGPTADCTIFTDIAAGPSLRRGEGASCCAAGPGAAGEALTAVELARR